MNKIIVVLCVLPLVFGAPATPPRRQPQRVAYNRPAYRTPYGSPYQQPYGSPYQQPMGAPCGLGAAPCGQAMPMPMSAPMPMQMPMPMPMPAPMPMPMPYPQMPMQQPYGASCSPMCASYPLAYQAQCCKRSQKS